MFTPDATTAMIDKIREETLENGKVQFSLNDYDGPYRQLFVFLEGDVCELVTAIRNETADGFQLRDLGAILAKGGPVLERILKKIETMGYREDRERVFNDLVVFLWYEIESRLRVWKLLKPVFGFVVKAFLAGRIARYLILAIDYVNGRVKDIQAKLPAWVNDLMKRLAR